MMFPLGCVDTPVIRAAARPVLPDRTSWLAAPVPRQVAGCCSAGWRPPCLR